MDSEKLKQFIVPIALLVASVIVLLFFVPKIIQNAQTGLSAKSEYDTTFQNLKEAQARLEKLQKEAEEQAKKEADSAQVNEKPFFKPVVTGMDTEAVIAGEFTEILQLIRANRIKVRSIKYDYDPQDDNFVKGAAAKYNVARLNMEMVGSYTDYDNFLKELYKHEHFLDLQSVEIVPYRKNKKVLLINFKLKLYAKK